MKSDKIDWKLLVIVGPTAVGKSALAVTLAKRFEGEIISADSRQVYKGLNIGTGKITEREMKGVPHHLLDIASPKKQYTVSEYQRMGREKMEEIFKRGKLPIIVGGTGLYVQALVNNASFPEVPPNLKLRKKLEKKTAQELFGMLKKLDPNRAKTIDAANPRRLVRAIEIAAKLGAVPPFKNTPREDISPLFIGLTLPPDELKVKITTRLFARLQPKGSYSGQARIRTSMVGEVRSLHAKGLSWKRMEELGLEYRYVSRYLRGSISKAEMIEKLRSEIWQYAKRQMTWFKRDKRVRWFKLSQIIAIKKDIRRFLSL